MIFDHVLAFIIDPTLHPYPSEYFYELDFYGVNYTKSIYKVNMLGKIYYIKTEILMKIPFFVKLINKINDSSVEIFVDRSPELFNQILSYINDEKYKIDCTSELDFYEIKYSRFKIERTDINKFKDDVENDLYKINNNLSDINSNISDFKEKLENITKVSINKFCIYPDCERTFESNPDYRGDYCDNHNYCRHCYETANRSDDYLCDYHHMNK